MIDIYQQIFFATLAFAFAILHLFLYLYNPRNRSNLYFTLFLVIYALNIFFDYGSFLTTNWTDELFYLRLHRAVSPYTSIFALLFLYSAFEFRISKQFWFIAAVLIITGILAVIDPVSNFTFVQYAMIAVPVEAIIVFRRAVGEKKYDAWILAAGFILLFLFSGYDLLMDLGLIEPLYNIHNGYPIGFVCLIIFISIFLARDFARARDKILEQEKKAREMEVSQRLLEIEDSRKSRELEEARQLQLSMLPQCASEVNGLEICFDMRTATEVGGDYYDYKISGNGSLIFTIGDATGHGMKAGIMVAIVKSLFLADMPGDDFTAFFEKCSRTIKQMHMGNLYMSLMLVKIEKNKMILSSAGMPPFYIFRQGTGQVEEHVVKGMPLGAFDTFPYQTFETDLLPGDTVMLMSDGFSEQFNDRQESLDDHQIRQKFEELAERPPTEIVRSMFEFGDQWRRGSGQRDDITFIVFKVKNNQA